MHISFPIDGLRIPTTNATATSAATLSGGSPAITINRYGSGYGIAYAFFPGFHYQQSANWDDTTNEPSQGTRLPYGWGPIQRDIIVAPAKIGNHTQNRQNPITVTYSSPPALVETCLLESDKGIAIVLLNWSADDTPGHVQINNLTITINATIPGIPGNPGTPTIPVGGRRFPQHN